MKTILLYVDSLVYGKVSRRNERFSRQERIGGFLEQINPDSLRVLEEGLRARTLVGENGFFDQRDGLEQFGPILGSHLPLDYLVILLGTNDSNAKSTVTDTEIEQALKAYVKQLVKWSEFHAVKIPSIVLCVPPSINTSAYDQGAKDIFGNQAVARLDMISRAIINFASDNNVILVDLSGIVPTDGTDGVHLTAKQNNDVAVKIHKAIL